MTEADPSSAPAAPGTLLAGRYRLDQRIGRGGMAEVFLGRDELLDRPVAVKVFRFDVDDTEQQRIESEMRTLAALRHPNLVTLYDASAGDDASGHAPFLVMEYIAGSTLTDRLARGPLAPGETATLGADLAAALQHVHANGIVHRDVKPANILLDDEHGGVVPKLTDFGIARITDGTRVTADGMTIGTANYLSPEQARGADVGPASDIYSLGLVLIECLTGAVAFPGTGVEAALARLSRPPQIPEQFGPQWAQLLAAMSAMDPLARPDAATVRATLAGLRADAATAPLAVGAVVAAPTMPLGDPTPLAGTAVLPTPARRSRLPLVVGALAVVAALIAILAVALDSGSGPTMPGVPADHTSRTAPTSPVARHSTTARRSTTVSHAAPPPVHPKPKPKPKPEPKPKQKPKPHEHDHKSGHGHGHDH